MVYTANDACITVRCFDGFRLKINEMAMSFEKDAHIYYVVANTIFTGSLDDQSCTGRMADSQFQIYGDNVDQRCNLILMKKTSFSRKDIFEQPS